MPELCRLKELCHPKVLPLNNVIASLLHIYRACFVSFSLKKQDILHTPFIEISGDVTSFILFRENMYQDHLHKITQDSENQRQRRDEIIKNLQSKVSHSEGELQKTRAKHATDEYVLGALCNNTV